MTAFLLKLIALLSMMVDHTGVVFQPLLSAPDYDFMRCIGRMAFPVFLFFIAEGCRHTSSINLFIVRLGAFALISELPFDLALASFRGAPSDIFSLNSYSLTEYQNVFFTFFFGAVCVYLYKKFNRGSQRLIYCFLIPAFIYFGNKCNTDYGSVGVLFVFILYVLPYGRQTPGFPKRMSEMGKFLRIAALFCMLFYLYIIKNVNWENGIAIIETGGFLALLEFLPQMISPRYVTFMLFSCISLLLLFFYNGKRGMPQRWLFYSAYPAHLLLLGILRLMYIVPGMQ